MFNIEMQLSVFKKTSRGGIQPYISQTIDRAVFNLTKSHYTLKSFSEAQISMKMPPGSLLPILSRHTSVVLTRANNTKRI